jgi:hypothetical protein
MTAADKIAADLRDAFRRIEPPDLKGSLTFTRADVAVRNAIQAAYQANDFDSAMSRAVAAIVALDDAEAAAEAGVKAAQARMATVTEASAKAREALRQALDACGGPGAATVETEHHTARLNPGGKRVEITDEKALPADCWRVKQEPDKALIKAIIAKGDAIPGTALVQSPSSLVITAKDR